MWLEKGSGPRECNTHELLHKKIPILIFRGGLNTQTHKSRSLFFFFFVPFYWYYIPFPQKPPQQQQTWPYNFRQSVPQHNEDNSKREREKPLFRFPVSIFLSALLLKTAPNDFRSVEWAHSSYIPKKFAKMEINGDLFFSFLDISTAENEDFTTRLLLLYCQMCRVYSISFKLALKKCNWNRWK